MSGRHRKPTKRVWPILLMPVGGGLAVLYQAPADPPPAPVAPIIPVVLTQPAATPAPVVKTVAQKTIRRVPPLVGAVGLVPNAKALAGYIQANYPDVTSIMGVRPCDAFMEHCRGVALDVMVDNPALGDRIDADLLAQADRFGIRYTLWEQAQHNPSGSVLWMGNRGTPTANHMDHIHARVAA